MYAMRVAYLCFAPCVFAINMWPNIEHNLYTIYNHVQQLEKFISKKPYTLKYSVPQMRMNQTMISDQKQLEPPARESYQKKYFHHIIESIYGKKGSIQPPSEKTMRKALDVAQKNYDYPNGKKVFTYWEIQEISKNVYETLQQQKQAQKQEEARQREERQRLEQERYQQFRQAFIERYQSANNNQLPSENVINNAWDDVRERIMKEEQLPEPTLQDYVGLAYNKYTQRQKEPEEQIKQRRRYEEDDEEDDEEEEEEFFDD